MRSSTWELTKTQIPPPQWAVKDVLPWSPDVGTRLLVTGPPKAGKSRLVMELIFSLTTGANMLHNTKWNVVRRTPVLYINEENTLGMLKTRFSELVDQAGYGELVVPDEDDVFHLPHVNWFNTPDALGLRPMLLWIREGVQLPASFQGEDTEGWLAQIEEEVEALRLECPGERPWVILDTWGKTQIFEVNDYQRANAALELLNEMQRELDVNIGLVHHSNKDREARGDSKTLGSQAIAGWYDAHLQLVYRDGNGIIELRREFREFEPPDDVWLTFDEGVWQVHDAKPSAKADRQQLIKNKLFSPGSGLMPLARSNALECARQIKIRWPDEFSVGDQALRKDIAAIVAALGGGDDHT